MPVWFSPGRVNLIGEHTDYNGGRVLPIAMDLGTTFQVDLIRDASLRICSQRYDEQVVLPLEGPYRARGHWQDYFAGVLHALAAAPSTGLSITVSSNLPQGGGLSSSASLTMGFAMLLNEAWELGKSRLELAHVAQRAENELVGVDCGILDPFAVAMGRSGQAIALDCRSFRWHYVEFPEGHEVVVINSLVKRELTDSEYNTRRQECARAVELINHERSIQCLGDLASMDLDTISSLNGNPVALRRARHVVEENARVDRAVSALQSGDMGAFGEELLASHASLARDYQVSCAELDFLVETASGQPGVCGAKMTGGGFGGCVVAVARTDAVAPLVEELGARYDSRFGIQAHFHSCRPGDGVKRLQ